MSRASPVGLSDPNARPPKPSADPIVGRPARDGIAFGIATPRGGSCGMTIPARARYGGYRFPSEMIGHAVRLYFRFPLGLRMVEELLAAREDRALRMWCDLNSIEVSS
jgi:hypothetical protein